MDKITVVADRGLNCGPNLEYLYNNGHDFVTSYTVKRSPQEFKELVWDKSGWISTEDKDSKAILYKEKVIEQELKCKVPVTPVDPQKASIRKEADRASMTKK